MSLGEILDDGGDPQNTHPKQAPQLWLELLQDFPRGPVKTIPNCGTRKTLKLRVARDVAQMVEHLPSVH